MKYQIHGRCRYTANKTLTTRKIRIHVCVNENMRQVKITED